MHCSIFSNSDVHVIDYGHTIGTIRGYLEHWLRYPECEGPGRNLSMTICWRRYDGPHEQDLDIVFCNKVIQFTNTLQREYCVAVGAWPKACRYDLPPVDAEPSSSGIYKLVKVCN